ncbi:MAG: ribosome biogenesis GTPase Der [Anaerolineae bacterium]|nr:ribosome biogenesis GTPase Der [Anaerolineae bacterium]
MKPIVAVVGRPNVGKSTLFNRLIGQPLAIVEDSPGTTRDRLYADSEWNGRTFTVVDTGGLVFDESGEVEWKVREQAQIAIAEADVIVFMVDASTGLTAADREAADLLRRTDKPIVIAANKADNEERRQAAVEFYELGLGDPIPISALHGTGTGDLLDAITASFAPEVVEEPDEAIRVAIVGRPNVGKSSLLNALLGEERAIVSEIPGTTRDAIDTRLEWAGQPVVLIDTAGIRRRGRIEPGVEKYSVLRAMRAIQRADVAVLVLDGVDGPTAQDAHVAGYILEEMKSVIVAVNKWDLVPKDSHTMHQYTQVVRAALRFMDYVPVLFISAKTGQRVGQVLDTALRVRDERLVRLSTAELNDILRQAVARQAPPTKAGKSLKFYYVTQPSVDPPTFVFFVNDKELVHFSYVRYLENQIRERYPFTGTPLRMLFRGREPRRKKR